MNKNDKDNDKGNDKENKVLPKSGAPKLFNRETGESMMEYIHRMENRTDEEKINDDRKDKLDWILE